MTGAQSSPGLLYCHGKMPGLVQLATTHARMHAIGGKRERTAYLTSFQDILLIEKGEALMFREPPALSLFFSTQLTGRRRHGTFCESGLGLGGTGGTRGEVGGDTDGAAVACGAELLFSGTNPRSPLKIAQP